MTPAFLAMDLDRLGLPDLAEQFIDWYAEFTADPAPAGLRHHYVAYRALVRAKVGCIRAAQDQPHSMTSAGQLADLALRHLRAAAVTLILVGGPPGTGKTVLSGQVAARLGCVVLGSDTIRKELAGVPPRQRRGCRIWHRAVQPGLDRAHVSGTAGPGRQAARPRRVGDTRRVLDLGGATQVRRGAGSGGCRLISSSYAARSRRTWPRGGFMAGAATPPTPGRRWPNA